MAVLMIEGFEVSLGQSDWNYKYGASNHGNISTSFAGPYSLQAIGFDSGGASRFGLPCPNGANGTLVAGFAFYLSAVHASNTRPLLRFRDATTADQCGIWVTPGRQLAFYRGTTLVATSTFQVTLAAWIYLEVKVAFGASGSYEVRAGGVNVLSAAGVNTISTANSSADMVFFGAVDSVASHSFRIDDIYVDSSDFLGECRVFGIKPTSDGTYQELTPSTGTAHFSRVDESGGADSETVYGSAAGLRDTFGMSDIAAGSVVAAVQVNALMRSDGTRGGAALTRTNGADVESSASALSVTPTYRKILHAQNPVTSAAWTAAEVNALETGFKITS